MNAKFLVICAVLLCNRAVFAGEDIVIGLITKTGTNPFSVKMTEGAELGATVHGIKLLTAAGQRGDDYQSQISAIESMVAAGAKTILISPNDPKAIVPALQVARAKGVQVIALDSPTDPINAVDALFSTNNYKAGMLIGQYAKAVSAARFPGQRFRIATLDLFPGHPVGAQRHNGFMSGLGLNAADSKSSEISSAPEIVCMGYSQGDEAKGRAIMAGCLKEHPDINLVYAINDIVAAGAYQALKDSAKEKNVIIVSVNGGCGGVKNVRNGVIAATAQQYPLTMAAMGVDAGVAYAKHGTKASGYVDTGVTLITDRAMPGVESKDTAAGLDACFGPK